MNDIRNRCHSSSETSFFETVFVLRRFVSILPGVSAFALAAIAFQGTAVASSHANPSSFRRLDISISNSEPEYGVFQRENHADTSGGSSQTAAAMLLFVNPLTGNDVTGDGSQRSPLRTLTHALEQASAGTTIMLAPGIYGAESGEQFPIRLKQGVTVHGNPGTQGDGILIRGGGDYVSLTATRQNIAILGADQATLTGVTVTNPNSRGYGVWVESSSPNILDNTLTGNLHDGISVNGTSAPLIQRNHIVQNGANGVTVFGRSHPRIQDNLFEETGYGINLGDSAAPIIINNRIVNNRSGVVAQEQSRPVLRHNVIENNQQSGVVAIAQAQPNLGTLSDPGNNQFSGNGQNAINADVADFPVIAAGNQIDPSRIVGTVDFEAQQSSAAPVASAPAPLPVSSPMAIAPDETAQTTTVPPTAASPTVASPLLEQAIDRIPALPLSAENATELVPTAPLSAENAVELIPVTISPTAPRSDITSRSGNIDTLILPEPLSAENATELIPTQRSSVLTSEQGDLPIPTLLVPASMDSPATAQPSTQQSAAPGAESQIEAPIPIQLPNPTVPQSSPPADESGEVSGSLQEALPSSPISSSASPSSLTIQAPVRIGRSPTASPPSSSTTPSSTTPFPRPTAITAPTPISIGNDALSIDEFVAPESRSSSPSSESSHRSEASPSDRPSQPEQTPLAQASLASQDTESEEEESASTSSIVLRGNEADTIPQSSQRMIRPILHRSSVAVELDTSSANPSEVALTSASVSEPIPIRVIDPPVTAIQEQPEVQALMVNPAALSYTDPSSAPPSSASPGHEAPRLINPAAASVNSSVNPSVAIAPQLFTLPRNDNLLPVPSADVPYGHVGDMARISVGDNPLANRLGIVNNRASLRYRVVVDGQIQDVDAVRAVSPGAFQTWLNGRSLIQVGAFADLENANEVAQLLANRGIQAEIQPMQ